MLASSDASPTWIVLLLLFFMDYKSGWWEYGGEWAKGREGVDQDIKTPQNIWGRSCALENNTGVQRRQSFLKGHQTCLKSKEGCISHGDPFTWLCIGCKNRTLRLPDSEMIALVLTNTLNWEKCGQFRGMKQHFLTKKSVDPFKMFRTVSLKMSKMPQPSWPEP